MFAMLLLMFHCIELNTSLNGEIVSKNNVLLFHSFHSFHSTVTFQSVILFPFCSKIPIPASITTITITTVISDHRTT